MNKRERQREYIERYSTPLGVFAEAAYAECGRGAIFMRWPDGKSEDWVYIAEDELLRCLSTIILTMEEMEGDNLVRAVGGYDPSWEAVIIFLNEIERGVDLHRVGFIPEGPFEPSFVQSTARTTSH